MPVKENGADPLGSASFLALGKCKFGLGGALRRRGSLFVKSSAKTFLKGIAVVCVIFGGEALASPPVRAKYGQKKASFLLPVFRSDLGVYFSRAKSILPKMTWIAHDGEFWGR